MKRFLPFILIVGFLFPVLGHAATTSVQTSAVAPTDISDPALQGQTLAAKQKLVSKALLDIYTRLDALSSQTQLAINQLDANGITVDEAQIALITANTTMAKAKTDITAFSAVSVGTSKSPATLETLKNAANTAEKSLLDAKNRLISSLAILHASLSALDTASQS